MDTQRALREIEFIKQTGPKLSDLVVAIIGFVTLVLGMVFGIGFCLTVLEINSIFSRVLASWHDWHYGAAAFGCYVITAMVAKRMDARMNQYRR